MGILQDRIKSSRLRQNITLKELALKLNVKEATMQRYESGEIKNIKHETIVMLADALSVTPAYLMGWDDLPAVPKEPQPTEEELELVRMLRTLDEDDLLKVYKLVISLSGKKAPKAK